ALRHLLRALPRPRGDRQRHDRRARLQAGADLPSGPPARRRRRLSLRDHDRGLRRHAELRGADPDRRPLGHRGVGARASAESVRDRRRRPGERPVEARCVTSEGRAMIPLPDDHPLHRLARTALLVGGVGAVACLVGLAIDPGQVVRSYLVAYLYCTGAALGSVALLMINHVTGGAWGVAIRRFLEAMMRLLPVLAVLFLPIALGLPAVYEWARPDAVAHDALLQHKQPFLNVPFFLLRTIGYFTAWIVVSRALVRWSDAQDATTDPKPTERLELISRGGLLLMGLTMTFASIDWMMS